MAFGVVLRMMSVSSRGLLSVVRWIRDHRQKFTSFPEWAGSAPRVQANKTRQKPEPSVAKTWNGTGLAGL